jgi:hypothetical protein
MLLCTQNKRGPNQVSLDIVVLLCLSCLDFDNYAMMFVLCIYFEPDLDFVALAAGPLRFDSLQAHSMLNKGQKKTYAVLGGGHEPLLSHV